MNSDLDFILAALASLVPAAVVFGVVRAKVGALEKAVDRLDETKASKESVDGLTTRLDERFQSLSRHIDDKFAALEKMIRGN